MAGCAFDAAMEVQAATNAIAQEALHNVAKHSQARTATVRLIGYWPPISNT
jgi:signal transduction histidine kinase